VATPRASFTAALLLAALAVVGACRQAPMAGVGYSAPRPVPSSSATVDGGAYKPSPVPADFRAHMARVVDRQVSRGHGEKLDGIGWVDETARAGWDAGGALGDGSTLVEELIEKAAKGDHGAGLLLMEKREGAWRFTAIGPDGDTVDDARTAPCKTCHDGAPRDDVFRPGQNSSTATSATMTAIAPSAVATTAASHDARSAGSAASPSSR
jgi:hypothetical protein